MCSQKIVSDNQRLNQATAGVNYPGKKWDICSSAPVNKPQTGT